MSQLTSTTLYNLTRRRTAAILAAVSLAFICPELHASGLDPASPWPMFHRSATHDGRTFSTPPDTPEIAWSAALSDSVEYSSPALAADGTVYLADQGKELWAFTREGVPKWNYHTLGNIRYSSPAVGADSTVYVGSADGSLYAIRPDGTLKWAAPTGGPVKTAPAVAEDGTIYAGSDDGKLWAFYPDGSTKWTFATGDTVRSSPAIGPDGTVYFGSNDGLIYAVYPSGGLRWSGATGGPIKGGPAIDAAGSVIIGSSDGFLYSVTPDGQLNWAVFTNHNLRTTPAVGGFNKIYIGMDTAVACFHSDGSAAWDYDTGARVLSSPVVFTRPDTTDLVLCGSDNGNIYLFDYGQAVWALSLGSPVRSSAAVDDEGRIYIGAMEGRLYAITGPTTAVLPGDPGHGLARARLHLAPNPLDGSGPVAIRLSGTTGRRAGVVSVFDPAGRRVFRTDFRGSGPLVWDGRDSAGRSLPSGVYLVRWSDGNEAALGRLVRLR